MPKYTKKFVIFVSDVHANIYLYNEDVDARFVKCKEALLFESLKLAVEYAKKKELERHSKRIDFLDSLKYSDFNA